MQWPAVVSADRNIEMSDHHPESAADVLRARLRELYSSIDKRAGELSVVHAGRLRCGAGCCDCCVDDITVFTVEADNIRSLHRDLLATGTPHPAGACAFLDNNGECRIYDARPYVCRTQGLPLHWIEEADDGTTVAMRDICPGNDDGIPVEELDESDCWIIGPAEEELAKLHYKSSGGKMVRCGLRDLFSGNG